MTRAEEIAAAFATATDKPSLVRMLRDHQAEIRSMTPDDDAKVQVAYAANVRRLSGDLVDILGSRNGRRP